VAPPSTGRRHIHFVLPQLLEMVRSTLIVLIVALFIITFLLQPFRIPSESMERTLLVGDFLLVDKVAFAPAGFCPIAR
jgi:signal peptidase I